MLKNCLGVNAAFSLSSSLFILFGNTWLSVHIPLMSIWWNIIGLGLLGFAFQLVLMIKIKKLRFQLILLTIYSDWAWVVITSTFTIIYWDHISMIGIGVIEGVNVVVASMAILQQRYLKTNNTRV